VFFAVGKHLLRSLNTRVKAQKRWGHAAFGLRGRLLDSSLRDWFTRASPRGFDLITRHPRPWRTELALGARPVWNAGGRESGSGSIPPFSAIVFASWGVDRRKIDAGLGKPKMPKPSVGKRPGAQDGSEPTPNTPMSGENSIWVCGARDGRDRPALGG